MRLNHLALVLASFAFAFGAFPARATWYSSTGKVAKVYSNDWSGSQGPNGDHFTVEGLVQAGSCPTNDGLVALALRGDGGGHRQMSMVLLARAMGYNLHVRVEDSLKSDKGLCLLQVLEIER